MSKTLRDDKGRQKLIEKAIGKAQKYKHVAVGILQDEKHDNGFSMVDLAMVHEYGSSDGTIKERSFIRSTCDEQESKYNKFIGKICGQIIDGKVNIKQALGSLGEVVSKDMVQTINNGIDEPLKLATIKRKKSSKPLIDTGRLKGSITHEVRGG